MQALELGFQVALVFAPHIGYVAQYREIHQTNSTSGYAPLVSLILITSNTLRIYYYLGEHYLFALLCQAFVCVAVHGLLLWKVLEVHGWHLLHTRAGAAFTIDSAATEVEPFVACPSSVYDEPRGQETTTNAVSAGGAFRSSAPSASAGNAQAGLSEGTLGAYSSVEDIYGEQEASVDVPTGLSAVTAPLLRFLFFVEDSIEEALLRHTPMQLVSQYLIVAAITLALVLLYYVSIGRVWGDAPAVVGYLSLGIESLLVVPQILRNARRRSTEGLTLLLILTWVAGDVIKVVYFILMKQALPFIVCGCFQIALDVVVVAQLIHYRFILGRDAEVRAEEERQRHPAEPLLWPAEQRGHLR